MRETRDLRPVSRWGEPIRGLQWNIGEGDRDDFEEIYDRISPHLVSLNEGGDKDELKAWIERKYPHLRLMEGQQPGMPSTPTYFNRNRFDLVRRIRLELPRVRGEKQKWCAGERLYDELNETLIDFVNVHMYHNQDDSEERRRAVNQALHDIDRHFLGRRVPTLLVGDFNRSPRRVLEELGPEWRCNHLELGELTTHGKSWSPDQAWLRRTPETQRWRFRSHQTVKGTKKNPTDHLPLGFVISLRGDY